MLQNLKTKFPRVVILGAGFGGVEAARQFNQKEFEVLLIDRNNFHTFQPLLYQVATGTLASDSIAFPIRKMFSKQDNLTFRMAEIFSVNRNEKTVSTSVGDFEYDFLIMAMGATSNFFGNENVSKYSLPLKSVLDALNIRNYILKKMEEAILHDATRRQSYLKFVIVGGGPTGVELSGAIAEIKKFMVKKDYPELSETEMKVYLVEGTGTVLPALSEKSQTDAKRYLQELGVTVILNTFLKDYDGEVVTLSNGEKIEAKTMIWSAGVMGEIPDGIPSDLVEKGNRVRTNGYCQLIDAEDVYVVGDMSAMLTEEHPKGLPGVAPVAQQQGKYTAVHIRNSIKGEKILPFKYINKGSMATVGRDRAVVELNSLYLNGFLAWSMWMFVHLVSIFGFRNRMVTFVNWTIKFFTRNSGIRLIIEKN